MAASVDPSSQVLSELLPWQSKRFRDYELSWTKAVESLTTVNPVIEVRSNKDGSRWTVYNKVTDKIAIFSHAGIWCWASPPQTGNFVPEGESAPDGVHSSRVMPVLSRRVETSYAINTEDDPSFYKCAQLLEKHVQSLKGFNKYKKDRRHWQEGDTPFSRRRFIFSSRLVVRTSPMNTKEGPPPLPPYKLHPWLQDALKAQKYQIWMANPEMPAILDLVDGKLEMLKPTTSRYFKNGDIVWFSFALSFDVNSANWMPEFKPLDFIRVGALPWASDSSTDFNAAESVGSAYQSLPLGAVSLLDDSQALESFSDREAVSKDLKRGRDPDGDETMSDSDLSERSAHSAAQAAMHNPSQRLKLDGSPVAKPPSSKGSEEPAKRKSLAKGKGK